MNAIVKLVTLVLLEPISKMWIRVRGKAQTDRERRCSQHTWVCEHLSEAVLHHTLENQMRIPPKRGNAAMGT